MSWAWLAPLYKWNKGKSCNSWVRFCPNISGIKIKIVKPELGFHTVYCLWHKRKQIKKNLSLICALASPGVPWASVDLIAAPRCSLVSTFKSKTIIISTSFKLSSNDRLSIKVNQYHQPVDLWAQDSFHSVRSHKEGQWIGTCALGPGFNFSDSQCLSKVLMMSIWTNCVDDMCIRYHQHDAMI